MRKQEVSNSELLIKALPSWAGSATMARDGMHMHVCDVGSLHIRHLGSS